jgi:DNA-binding Lrp family transcriptional regulator
MSERRLGSAAVVPAELDDIDRPVISLLAADARLSTRAIAREVGMSAGAISERIDRLEQRGVIVGYHAHIDLAALGYPIVAIIGLQIEHGHALIFEVMDRLMSVPFVQRIQMMTGEWDLLVELCVADHNQLRDLLLEQLWEIPGFRQSQTMISLETRGRPGGWAPPIASPGAGGGVALPAD